MKLLLLILCFMLIPMLAFSGEIGRISLIEVWDKDGVIFRVSDAGVVTGCGGRYIGLLTESERTKMAEAVGVYAEVAKQVEALGK